MPCELVLGGQWGDEGKGKIVDVLAEGVDAVVRCQGGANAGHTLVTGNQKLPLHLVPSGVRHPGCQMILGSGMVVDPVAFLTEIRDLESNGLELRSRLRVSRAAHAVLPCHVLEDRLEEKRRGGASVGTTGRGIGPAYADRAARRGVPLGVFGLPEAETRSVLEKMLDAKREALGPEVAFDVRGAVEKLLGCRDEIGPLLCDTTVLLHQLVDAGKHLLLEGAQGALLDLDHGSYPYVTSSSCTSAGMLAGCGLPPQVVTRVTGVLKAYATRVGNGPFPTELHGPEAEKLRELGQEFGTTTGRPRRCGWFDAVAARYARRLSGFTELAITKLDVLDRFETIRIADWYEIDGQERVDGPLDVRTLEHAKPGYRTVEGWRESTRECRRIEDLPTNARRFLALLEERVGVSVRIVSVGPDRESTLRVPGGVSGA